jgi:hypothetical protein
MRLGRNLGDEAMTEEKKWNRSTQFAELHNGLNLPDDAQMNKSSWTN